MKTPQEVADFLGKVIAMSRDGLWCWFHAVPPEKNRLYDCWDPGQGYELGWLPQDFIDYDGDWEDSVTFPTGKARRTTHECS